MCQNILTYGTYDQNEKALTFVTIAVGGRQWAVGGGRWAVGDGTRSVPASGQSGRRRRRVPGVDGFLGLVGGDGVDVHVEVEVVGAELDAVAVLLHNLLGGVEVAGFHVVLDLSGLLLAH